MATRGNEKSAAAAVNTAPTVAAEKQEETKYHIGKLRENCMQLFGITTSTFDGAFYGNTAQEMSITEAKSRINKWLGRKE